MNTDPQNQPVTIDDLKKLRHYLDYIINLTTKENISDLDQMVIDTFDPENWPPVFNILIAGEYRIIKQERFVVDGGSPLVTVDATKEYLASLYNEKGPPITETP